MKTAKELNERYIDTYGPDYASTTLEDLGYWLEYTYIDIDEDCNWRTFEFRKASYNAYTGNLEDLRAILIYERDETARCIEKRMTVELTPIEKIAVNNKIRKIKWDAPLE